MNEKKEEAGVWYSHTSVFFLFSILFHFHFQDGGMISIHAKTLPTLRNGYTNAFIATDCQVRMQVIWCMSSHTAVLRRTLLDSHSATSFSTKESLRVPR